uniref:Secreted protein n=1 Tax=Arundo donax TaxID=35708 RepID=A0A0A9EPN6_ARUDO
MLFCTTLLSVDFLFLDLLRPLGELLRPSDTVTISSVCFLALTLRMFSAHPSSLDCTNDIRSLGPIAGRSFSLSTKLD